MKSLLSKTSYRLGLMTALTALTMTAPSRAAVTPIVINEIRAAGGDWIELHNPGAIPVNLSDWRVADSDLEGAPRLDLALRFPQGTVLPPQGFLLIVTERGKQRKKEKSLAEIQRLCPKDGAIPCHRARFGISKDRGEIVRLIAPDGSVTAEAGYPGKNVPNGRTWARLPDGTGAFAAAKPTPGRPNAK